MSRDEMQRCQLSESELRASEGRRKEGGRTWMELKSGSSSALLPVSVLSREGRERERLKRSRPMRVVWGSRG